RDGHRRRTEDRPPPPGVHGLEAPRLRRDRQTVDLQEALDVELTDGAEVEPATSLRLSAAAPRPAYHGAPQEQLAVVGDAHLQPEDGPAPAPHLRGAVDVQRELPRGLGAAVALAHAPVERGERG